MMHVYHILKANKDSLKSFQLFNPLLDIKLDQSCYNKRHRYVIMVSATKDIKTLPKSGRKLFSEINYRFGGKKFFNLNPIKFVFCNSTVG